MKSKILIMLVLAALLLSACQPAQTSTPSEASEAASGEPMNGCRVTGSQLQPNPTLVALFPAVSEEDWVIGPSDARVTILEYSDFQ